MTFLSCITHHWHSYCFNLSASKLKAMKPLKIKIAAMLLGLMLGATAPVLAQSSKDTSAITTKANGSGAGNGSSQGAPGTATVSGTGSGTLQDSDKTSVPSGDAVIKQSDAIDDQKAVNPSQVSGYWILGVFSLIGLIMLIILRKTNKAGN
jgi:cobalamin biosynthesis Mg chelatase CobN